MANFNFNKIILGGRLTANPELKTTPSGVTVCTFSMAVNRKGAKDQTTDFFNCTAWRGTAEFVSKFFTKGSSICVVGSVQMRSYTDKDGNKRTATDINVDEVLFVDGKNDNVAAPSEAPAFAAAPAEAPANFVKLGTDDSLPF